jgi:general secretion pathway protein K
MSRGPRRERGVALLTAILLVALGTIIAAAISYRNAMTARRGAANFAFEQALLFAEGAEALAAYALRDDATRGGNKTDHRGESWAKPYGPVEIAPGVVLTARLEDLNSRFNLNTLMLEDDRGERAREAFARLLESLDIEPVHAQRLADWLDSNPTAFLDGGEDNLYLSQDPPYLAANGPITSVSELLALPSFGRDNYLKLAPYVVALPPDAQFNSCTGKPCVLDAYSGSDQHCPNADSTLKQQEKDCFPGEPAYGTEFNDPSALTQMEQFPGIAEQSNYFRLTSEIRIGTAQFTLYSLLLRDDGRVKVVSRSFSPD